MLEETGHGDAAVRNGAIGVQPRQDTADLFFFQRTWTLLDGIKWTSHTMAGGKVTLKAQDEAATATAILRTSPRIALEKLSVVASLTTPVGETRRTQQHSATYALEKGALVLKSVETLDYALKPINKGMQTLHKVEGAQQNVPVPDTELAIAMPAGTKISDGRLDRPVRYVQGEQDLTLAELQALVEKKAANGAKVGAAAPSWALKGLDGKAYKPDDYRGKVVLLTWFASWCGPCHAEAPIMEKDIWGKYRAQGLSVFGVNAGEREDPEKGARSFVAQHSLTYPVLMDADDELTTTYKVEAFPTLVLIDRKGVIRYQESGFDQDTVVKTLEKLLAEK